MNHQTDAITVPHCGELMVKLGERFPVRSTTSSQTRANEREKPLLIEGEKKSEQLRGEILIDPQNYPMSDTGRSRKLWNGYLRLTSQIQVSNLPPLCSG